MLSKLFLATLCCGVFVSQASDGKFNLPAFAVEWKNAVAASEIDLAQITQVKRSYGDDETYMATLKDNTEVTATKSTSTKRIHCIRKMSEKSFVMLENKYFEQIKFIYFQNCHKK